METYGSRIETDRALAPIMLILDGALMPVILLRHLYKHHPELSDSKVEKEEMTQLILPFFF